MKIKELLVWMCIGVMMIAMSGCGVKSQLCLVPEAEGSKICALSDKLDIDPSYMSQGLLIVNWGVLKKGLYTPGQAHAFVTRLENELIDLRSRGKVYSTEMAIKYINKKIMALSPKARLAFSVTIDLDKFDQIELKLPITDYDFELLLRHLAKQKIIINLYL